MSLKTCWFISSCSTYSFKCKSCELLNTNQFIFSIELWQMLINILDCGASSNWNHPWSTGTMHSVEQERVSWRSTMLIMIESASNPSEFYLLIMVRVTRIMITRYATESLNRYDIRWKYRHVSLRNRLIQTVHNLKWLNFNMTCKIPRWNMSDSSCCVMLLLLTFAHLVCWPASRERDGRGIGISWTGRHGQRSPVVQFRRRSARRRSLHFQQQQQQQQQQRDSS